MFELTIERKNRIEKLIIQRMNEKKVKKNVNKKMNK